MTSFRPYLKAGGAFTLGAALGGVVTGAILVSFGRFDPKFQAAPSVAFELEVAGAAALAAVGGLIFTGVRWWKGRGSEARPSGWLSGLLFGFGFPVFLALSDFLILERLVPESLLLSLAVTSIVLIYPAGLALVEPQLRTRRSHRTS